MLLVGSRTTFRTQRSHERMQMCRLHMGIINLTFGHGNAIFCIYRPHKESISKEGNNDNDLSLHLHDQIVGLNTNPFV